MELTGNGSYISKAANTNSSKLNLNNYYTTLNDFVSESNYKTSRHKNKKTLIKIIDDVYKPKNTKKKRKELKFKHVGKWCEIKRPNFTTAANGMIIDINDAMV